MEERQPDIMSSEEAKRAIDDWPEWKRLSFSPPGPLEPTEEKGKVIEVAFEKIMRMDLLLPGPDLRHDEEDVILEAIDERAAEGARQVTRQAKREEE